MKFVLEMPVKVASGSMSRQPGIVFFPWRGLVLGRQHVIPRNPQTADQVAIRNYFTQGAQGFQSITLTQKQNWAAYALNHPHLFFGKEITIPEISAFQKVNMYRLIDGQSISNDAPTDLSDFVATDIANLAYASGTTQLTFDVTHNASVVTGKNWVIYITASLPSGVYAVRDGDYRLCKGVDTTSIVAVSASPQTVTITAPKFGNWANNDYVAVKLLPLSPDYDPGTVYYEVNLISVT